MPGVKLSPLLRLAGLVNLRVEGVTDTSMPSLAAVTQLTRLSVKLAQQGVRVASLVGVTALRRLRQLKLDATAVRLSEDWDGVKLDLSTMSHRVWAALVFLVCFLKRAGLALLRVCMACVSSAERIHKAVLLS